MPCLNVLPASKSAVIVTVDVKPDRIEEFYKVMEKDAIDSRNRALDPGAMRFDLVKSRETPNRYYFYEVYDDDDAVVVHKKTPHYNAWAEFKASGGATSDAVKCETVNVGDWALQANDASCSTFKSGVIITIDIVEEKVPEFLETIGADVKATRNKFMEPGMLRTDVLRSRDKPNRFYFYEVFTDDDATANHKKQPHYDVWAAFKPAGVVPGSQITEKIEYCTPWGFQSATCQVGCTQMPLMGFGLYKVGAIPASASGAASDAAAASGPDVCRQIVHDALASGYSMYDCAQFYMNEAWVGEAFKAAKTPRKYIYLTGKVWNDTIYKGPEAVKAQVDKTIADLQCEYIDLMLVHWPVPGKHVAAYNALRECKASGKVREIGLSNYTIEDYEELRAAGAFGDGGKDKPALNQIEVNPMLFRKKTIDFFQKEGVVVQAYRGLMQGAKQWEACAPLQEVCKEAGRSEAQVLGRFLVQQGISHIPKASTPERMAQNRDVFSFELTAAQMQKLSGLTTPAALDAFKDLYAKCIWRDTPEAGAAMPGSRTVE